MQKKRMAPRKSARPAKKVSFGTKERKRLIQLCVCVGLFIIVFLGRSTQLVKTGETGEWLLELIRKDTDFVGAFSTFGETVSQGESVWTGLETLARELFGSLEEEEPQPKPTIVQDGPAGQWAAHSLSAPTTTQSMLRVLGLERQEEIPVINDTEYVEPSEPEPEPELSDSTEAVQEPEIPVYTGPALPAGATMEYYDLGLNNVVTPVFGIVSSSYGYRYHPISGEYAFHAGVDIAADTGTPIAAMADGVVEYIGDSKAYGLYVQLDHGGGVKSFYCHCSRLYYRQGTQVTAGQEIALVGDTGNTTGPHLHLELKKDGILLNPVYYIETLN